MRHREAAHINVPTDYALLAQTAMGLAGFTGIVGASQHRAGRPHTRRERMHLALIAQTSAFVVILGFLPSALALLRWPEDTVWRVSIGILTVAHLNTWIVLGWQTRGGRTIVSDLRGIERVIAFASLPVGLSQVAAECALLLGHGTAYAPFLYQSVLMLFVAVGLFSFLALLLNPE